MTIPAGLLLNGFDVFLLIFVRMTGLFVTAPIFGRRNVPVMMKVAFSFCLALIMVNTITLPKPDYYQNIYGYAFLIAKEFIVGIAIGYISYIIFSAIYVAGQLMDMQVGFGMVNVIDPVSNIQVPISSNFYFIISMLVLISTSGHHILIRGLFDSYKVIPLGGAVFDKAMMNDFIRIFGEIFVVGFQIAAPVIAAILITDIALGVIAKTIPQMNVFVVGMPLKIVIGVGIMILTIPVFMSFVGGLIGNMDKEMNIFIKHMGLK